MFNSFTLNPLKYSGKLRKCPTSKKYSQPRRTCEAKPGRITHWQLNGDSIIQIRESARLIIKRTNGNEAVHPKRSKSLSRGRPRRPYLLKNWFYLVLGVLLPGNCNFVTARTNLYFLIIIRIIHDVITLYFFSFRFSFDG